MKHKLKSCCYILHRSATSQAGHIGEFERDGDPHHEERLVVDGEGPCGRGRGRGGALSVPDGRRLLALEGRLAELPGRGRNCIARCICSRLVTTPAFADCPCRFKNGT